jgi:ABC-type polysaccharide/polyol phosphate transport system ATPase subunit
MARIELEDVSLTFRIRRHRRVPLKDYLVRQMFRTSLNPVVEVKALQHIDLRLAEGDRLGIIGQNGAGKTSLLKLLAGIYPPTHGTRTVDGRVSSLFDAALGFEMDATGWENIAYRSYLQGETPRSVSLKLQEIADFSELGSFLDMPVRYYSSGMVVRLAFSIVTAIDPQILLVDESLSAGDMAFQKKARARMMDMVARAQIVAVVSHDLGAIVDLCDQVLWLEHGTVRDFGPADPIVDAYRQSAQESQAAAV